MTAALLDFQERAAAQVAERYARHAAGRDAKEGAIPLPFMQAFAAVTQSGKTVVLAEAVARVQAAMAVKPVVLWLSRGRVAAQKSWGGLQAGRRHRALLDDVSVRLLADLDAADLTDARSTVLYFATVDTFGRVGTEQTLFSVSTSDFSALDDALLDVLRRRRGAGGVRRPLLLVYDEAHPLGHVQTERLLSLEPDLILLASTTMELPAGIARVAARLRAAGWRDSDLTTIPRLARPGA
ncbi:hypothetical protein [Capillimicrobium parvum]|uniref:Helicase/UvrB N-terminal domain-containing protein n=1 Tax=Capillimicrobium parvum TaxID=2884022 RepID=A0A9E6Y1A9_9ACTN|nr:hypothetical protein [Capillimicrobium parvum]UGS37596.1 hypothetical protein DSM104329_04013 [Capillimicrobium parvum]